MLSIVSKRALKISKCLTLTHFLNPQRLLQSLFGTSSQSVISDTIGKVTTALETTFLPENLGFSHISRAEALEKHSLDMYYKLFEEHDVSRIFLVLDGTYVYIERPTDFGLQRATYSVQKSCNLFKPFMIVLPNGYILDCVGPWLANGSNNDANILKAILKSIGGDCQFFKPGDHNVIDRGFRDVVAGLEAREMEAHMPKLLNRKEKEKQFSTEDANESRRVTLVRWLVEAVNGRIKRKFKVFKNKVNYGTTILMLGVTLCLILCLMNFRLSQQDWHHIPDLLRHGE